MLMWEMYVVLLALCSSTFPAAKRELETELRGEGGRRARCCSNIWEKVTSSARKQQWTLLTCMLNVCACGSSDISISLMSVPPCFMLLSFSSFLAGIRSWDVDLKCCDLDQQLQLFITRHSAHFSSEVRGQCDMAVSEPVDQWWVHLLWEKHSVDWRVFVEQTGTKQPLRCSGKAKLKVNIRLSY